MEYAVAAGGMGISDILEKMSANPWSLLVIALVLVVLYFVTTRAQGREAEFRPVDNERMGVCSSC